MAKKVISYLSAVLGADISQYEAGMKKASRLSESVSKGINDSMKGIAMGAAAYFTADAFIGYARGAITAAEAVVDLSAASGASAENMQALGYLARNNGSNAEEMATAMAKLTKEVQDAADGSASARQAFARLGLDWKTMKQESPEERLAAVGRAMYLLRGDTETVSSVMDLLGSKNAPKLNAALLALGEQGLPAAVKGAREAGQIMDTELAKSLDAANDRIENLKNRFMIGLGAVIGEFTQGAHQFEGIAKQFEKPIQFGRITEDQKGMGTGFARFALETKSVEDLTRALEYLRKLQYASGQKTFSQNTEYGALAVQVNTALEAAKKAAAAHDAESAALQKVSDAAKAAAAEEKALDEGMKDAAENARLYGDIEDRNSRILAANADSIRMHADALKEGQAVRESIQTPLERFNAEMERLDRLERMEAITAEENARATGIAGKAYADAAGDVEDYASRLQAAADDTGKKLPEMASEYVRGFELVMDRAESGITDALIDSLSGAEDAWADLGRMIVRQIAAMIIQLTIVRPLVMWIMGMFGFSAAASGAGAGAGATPHASGGSFSAGDEMLVGERGPEIVKFDRGGTVLTHGQSTKASQGSGAIHVYQTNHYASGVTRQEVFSLLPEIVKNTKSAVLDAVRRGGSFRAGMQGA